MSLLSKLLGDSKKELAPVLDALKEAALYAVSLPLCYQ